MKKAILIMAAVLLGTSTPVQAQQDEIGITLDLSYHTKWLSKGIEGYKQQGGLFKTIDIDLYGTGLGIKVTHRNATASGFVDNQRFDYRPYYKNQMFSDAPYTTNYNISVGYEHYPGLSRNKANTTYEWIFAFSWPNLLPEGFTPSYIAHYEYPAGSGNANRKVTGWVHRFKLDYSMNVTQLPNPLILSTEMGYYDGLAARNSDLCGYVTTGLSTKFNLTQNLCFVPGLYHQTTPDDSISRRKDITYAILSMKYKF